MLIFDFRVYEATQAAMFKAFAQYCTAKAEKQYKQAKEFFLVYKNLEHDVNYYLRKYPQLHFEFCSHCKHMVDYPEDHEDIDGNPYTPDPEHCDRIVQEIDEALDEIEREHGQVQFDESVFS